MRTLLLIALCACVATGVFTAFAVASSGADSEAPRLVDDAFQNPSRPWALFDHDLHMEMDPEGCVKCHHVYDENGQLVEGETSEGIPCHDCHMLEATADNSVPLQEAYHTRCITCHDVEDAGPVLCGECHVR